METWAGTARYVYNKCLNLTKLDPTLRNNKGYRKICKENITKKNNNIVKTKIEANKFKHSIYDWELKTPKDIRKGALRDIKKAYTTAFANLKNGNINTFGLNNRTKKNGKEQSMEIPNSSIKLIKKKNKVIGLKIYSDYIKDPIKIHKNSLHGINLNKIDHYCRLKKENNNWYLCIPFKANPIENANKLDVCAIDPNIRKFITVYSEGVYTEIDHVSTRKKYIHKFYDRLDSLKAAREKKLIKSKAYNRKRCKLQNKLNNYINELHYKTIKYLTTNYSYILMPSFETQDMIGAKYLPDITKRDMNALAFYKFTQRLKHKADLLKHCDVKIVNEAYTSQTCGYWDCGILTKSADETHACIGCKRKYDRDVNSSRNIRLKYI